MLTLLAAVSYDARRLRPVTGTEEAALIIEAVLGVRPQQVEPVQAPIGPPESGNDYWVVIDEGAVVGRAEYVQFGVIDAVITNVGRVTATVVTDE